MKVTIARFDPNSGRSWTQEYEVDTSHASMTVMDVLEYISKHLDHTLAYYKHSICNHGICGRCSVQVNGKVRLACIERVDEYESLELKPAATYPVLRDLVVNNSATKL